MDAKRKVVDFFWRADDRRSHLRTGEEGRLRRRIVGTGRAVFVLYMPLFGRVPGIRRPTLAAIALLGTIHGVNIRRLYRLFEREGRDEPPIVWAGAAHGVVGDASLMTLYLSEVRGRNRLTTAAEWYIYLGLAVDVIDGSLRRRRPLGPYALLTAALAVGGALRYATRSEAAAGSATEPGRHPHASADSSGSAEPWAAAGLGSSVIGAR